MACAYGILQYSIQMNAYCYHLDLKYRYTKSSMIHPLQYLLRSSKLIDNMNENVGLQLIILSYISMSKHNINAIFVYHF